MELEHELLMYFVYGLAFFALGLAVFIYPRGDSELKLARGLWLVGLFGLLHGLHEWMEMLALAAGSRQEPPFAIAGVILLPASFLCLLLYGTRQIQLRRGRWWALELLPVLLVVGWALATLLSDRSPAAADAWSRYLLALPGTLLAALAIRLNVPAWKATQKKTFVPDIRMIVIITLAYGFFAGLVVPGADFFPASVLNYLNFEEVVGVPVQIFRAACAASVTFFIMRALRVFDWEARASLAESERKYRFLFENMVTAVSYQKVAGVGRGGRLELALVDVNDTFEELFGVRRAEILGKNIDKVLPGTEENFQVLLDLHERIAWTGDKSRADLYFEPLKKWISVTAYSPKESFFVAVFEDVTLRKQREHELSSMALTDELTGIYNRRGFTTLARHQLKLAERSGSRLQLVFADLDDLKVINDTYGHASGDRALIDFAMVMKSTFRDSDVVGRIGGDEFVALAMDSPGPEDRTLIKRLQTNLDAHNADGSRPYHLSASAGVMRYDPQNPRSIEELLKEADQIMYANKRNRRHNQQNAAKV